VIAFRYLILHDPLFLVHRLVAAVANGFGQKHNIFQQTMVTQN